MVKELVISFAFVYRQEDFTAVVHLLGEGRIDAVPMISNFIGMAALPMEFEALKQPNRQIKVMLELP